jgi:hypothetical protein
MIKLNIWSEHKLPRSLNLKGNLNIEFGNVKGNRKENGKKGTSTCSWATSRLCSAQPYASTGSLTHCLCVVGPGLSARSSPFNRLRLRRGVNSSIALPHPLPWTPGFLSSLTSSPWVRRLNCRPKSTELLLLTACAHSRGAAGESAPQTTEPNSAKRVPVVRGLSSSCLAGTSWSALSSPHLGQ